MTIKFSCNIFCFIYEILILKNYFRVWRLLRFSENCNLWPHAISEPFEMSKYAKRHLNPYAENYVTKCAFWPLLPFKIPLPPNGSLILRIEEHPKCRKKVIFFAWSDPQNLSSISSSLQKIRSFQEFFYTFCNDFFHSVFYFTNLSSSLNFLKKF